MSSVAASGPARQDRGILAALARKLVPLAGILVFLVIWEAGVAISKAPAYLLPPPTTIVRVFFDELPKLLFHGWVTTYEMLVGYALAVGIAVPLAIAITSSQRFDRFVMPTDALLPGRAEDRDRAAVPGVVRRRRAAEGAGGIPDLVLPDRHRRGGGPALDVLRDERPRALDGRDADAGLPALSPADQPAVPLQRPEGRSDAGHRRRGRRRVRRRGQGARLPAAGHQLEPRDGADVRDHPRADDHRPRRSSTPSSFWRSCSSPGT